MTWWLLGAGVALALVLHRLLLASSARGNQRSRIALVDAPLVLTIPLAFYACGLLSSAPFPAPPDGITFRARFAWIVIGLPFVVLAISGGASILLGRRRARSGGRPVLWCLLLASVLGPLISAAGELALLDAQLLVLAGLVSIWILSTQLGAADDAPPAPERGQPARSAAALLVSIALGVALWMHARADAAPFGPVALIGVLSVATLVPLGPVSVSAFIAIASTLGLGLASLGTVVLRSFQLVRDGHVGSASPLPDAIFGVAQAFPTIESLGVAAPEGFAIAAASALLWLSSLRSGTEGSRLRAVIGVTLVFGGLVGGVARLGLLL